ncbi:MAG: hypothetical protein PVH29_02805 [Candidatus Zixiibacteriota bacterium]|jgi:hypothetical protein
MYETLMIVGAIVVAVVLIASILKRETGENRPPCCSCACGRGHKDEGAAEAETPDKGR